MQLTTEQLPDDVERIALWRTTWAIYATLREATEATDCGACRSVLDRGGYKQHDLCMRRPRHSSDFLATESQPNALALEIQDDGGPFDPRQADEPQFGRYPDLPPLFGRIAQPPHRRPQPPNPDLSIVPTLATMTKLQTSKIQNKLNKQSRVHHHGAPRVRHLRRPLR